MKSQELSGQASGYDVFEIQQRNVSHFLKKKNLVIIHVRNKHCSQMVSQNEMKTLSKLFFITITNNPNY